MDQDDQRPAGATTRDDRGVRLLINAGRIDEANALLDRIVSRSPDERDRETRSAVLTDRAVCAWLLRRIPLALDLAAEGWTDLDGLSTRGACAARTLGNLGYLMAGIGHEAAALDLLGQSVALAREAGDSETLAQSAQRLGGILNIQAYFGQPDHATAHFARSRELLAEGLALVERGKVSSGPLRIALIAGYAAALVGSGEVDAGLRVARRTVRIAAAEGNRWGIAVGNWVRCVIARREGRLAEARTLASVAVAQAERINDTTLLRLFSGDLADICAELDDPVGEATALRRNVAARQIAMETLKEGLLQALEQRRLAVKARRRASAEREAAARDPLTGLANRLGLQRSAPGLLESATTTGRTPWLVLIDVDWFKSVNDDSGHAAGDAALREIAALLRGECRAEDLVARWAGDEFVVLLSQPPGADLSAGLGPVVAERIRSAVHGHNWTSALGTAIGPTVSVGVSTGYGDLDSLFAAADAALYRAKRHGRNRVETQVGAVVVES